MPRKKQNQPPSRPRVPLTSLPDEILTSICIAHGSKPVRNDEFIQATNTVLTMEKNRPDGGSWTSMKRHPKEFLPTSQPIAQVCQCLREIYLQHVEKPEPITHAIILFPRRVSSLHRTEDFEGLKEVYLTPLIMLQNGLRSATLETPE